MSRLSSIITQKEGVGRASPGPWSTKQALQACKSVSLVCSSGRILGVAPRSFVL